MAQPQIINGYFAAMLKGQEEKDRCWGPFVDVEFGHPDLRKPRTKMKALVDTGSAACFMHREVAEKFDLPFLRSDQIFSQEGREEGKVYSAAIGFNFGENTRTYTSEIGTRDLTGVAFDIAIGWSVLSYYQIRISRLNRSVSLTRIRSSDDDRLREVLKLESSDPKS